MNRVPPRVRQARRMDDPRPRGEHDHRAVPGERELADRAEPVDRGADLGPDRVLGCVEIESLRGRPISHATRLRLGCDDPSALFQFERSERRVDPMAETVAAGAEPDDVEGPVVVLVMPVDVLRGPAPGARTSLDLPAADVDVEVGAGVGPPAVLVGQVPVTRSCSAHGFVGTRPAVPLPRSPGAGPAPSAETLDIHLPDCSVSVERGFARGTSLGTLTVASPRRTGGGTTRGPAPPSSGYRPGTPR